MLSDPEPEPDRASEVNMFEQAILGKRDRDIEDAYGAEGFSEHRTKRRIASLPDRTSPKQNRQALPNVNSYQSQPAPPTITPADSESEDVPASAGITTQFSTYSASPSSTITPTSPSLDAMNSSQSTQMSDMGLYSDEVEMSDSIHLSPGSFQTDLSPDITGRIPTPIHSNFAHYIRAEKASLNRDPDFADDEAMVDRVHRGRRLPSPISEGEMSPSVVLEGLGDMQMDMEASTPTKKGHNRSKHSLRSWTVGGEMGGSTKRTFTMGYRSDCEKCRNKVPGHFNHIITYD